MNDDRTDRSESDCGYRETRPMDDPKLEEWDEVPADPDASALGYDTGEWERIPTAEDDQVIFLPSEEEDIERDAFVVLQESALCDLVTRR